MMSQADQKFSRSAGMLFPVFSMRRDGDLGIGDTTAVKQSIDWLKQSDIGFLQLLPINVSGSDNSPYSAISSVALDFIYLDLEQIPELGESDIAAVREQYAGEGFDSEKVDYMQVRKVKSQLLRLAYERFLQGADAVQYADFEGFVMAEREWLNPYCKYRWLMEEAGGNEDWTSWPEEFNIAKKALVYEEQRSKASDGEPEAVQAYYAWVQWHAFAQWVDVRDYAEKRGVKLMGDIPIGVSCASADVFFEPQWFVDGWFGGAPPETVFKDDAFACKWGQNWGVPLYDWEALAGDNFAWWRRRIKKLTAIFQMFRIDHILGFYRIYAFPWHPKMNRDFLPLSKEEAQEKTGGDLPRFMPRADDSAENKAQNLMAGDRYLNAVLRAAEGYEVIGEDLGCVPDYVRPHLAELGIAGFKICHWETNASGDVLRPSEHPECAFATYATHDHPPIKPIWEELRKDMAKGCEKSAKSLKMISQYAGLDITKKDGCPPYSNVVKWSMIESLMKSEARYSALMINDVIDSCARINTPATVGEHNWTYRVPWAFDSVPVEIEHEMNQLAECIGRYDRAVGHGGEEKFPKGSSSDPI